MGTSITGSAGGSRPIDGSTGSADGSYLTEITGSGSGSNFIAGRCSGDYLIAGKCGCSSIAGSNGTAGGSSLINGGVSIAGRCRGSNGVVCYKKEKQ